MTAPNLNNNDFIVLGLPEQFQQDEILLTQRWKELQSEIHPDRFVSHDPEAQRLATQWSIRINEAFNNIKNPIKRATILCELSNTPVEQETNTSMPPEFLMQQMLWREALDDATSYQEVLELQNNINKQRTLILSSLTDLIDEKRDFEQAAQQVRSLMFLERFLDSINHKIDTLDV